MYDYNTIGIPIIPQDTWEIIITPYGIDWDGSIKEWSFCLPEFMITNEQFTNGTQYCLTKWFKTLTGKNPTHKSYMKMEMSTKPIKDGTTKWTYLSGCSKPMGSWFEDSTGSNLWLCPLWTMMWGGNPDTYLKLTPFID